MARKDRSLAGFDDVASENNVDINENDNININRKNEQSEQNNDPDFLDKLLEDGNKKKNELVLTGVYLQPELAKILDNLGKKGGRGAKSRLVNDALRKMFAEKGLI